MSILCGIYSITNMVNGKKIIGQSKNIYNRWSTYKYKLRHNNYKNNAYLQNAWNKYGERNFKFEIIKLTSIDKLDYEEVRLIKRYQTTNHKFGYNLMPGGNRPIFSKETLLKMSKSRVGKRHSEESKIKMSNAQKGAKNHRYGKTNSKKFRAQISKALKGRKLTSEHINKIRKASLNMSEETKRKISESKKGHFPTEETRLKLKEARRNMPIDVLNKILNAARKVNIGKPRSEETKRKISESKKRTSYNKRKIT